MVYGGIVIQKLSFIAILTLVIILYISFIRVNVGMTKSFNLFAVSQKKEAISERTKYRKLPLILTWTKWFERSLAEVFYNEMKGCDYQCTITDRRRVETLADVVMFHIWDLDVLDLPKNRSHDQLYLFYLLESPELTGDVLDTIPKDFFNLSITYRRDSNIFSPYGVLRKINSNTPKDQIWNWTEVEKIARGKTGMALQLVSNCNTSSKREKYVDQLKHYVKTTQRGVCNGVECDKECARHLLAEHRFYLAFENSVCRDYITEKLFGRMEKLVVPIVLKKSLYIDTLPPGSYIAVDDFKSPLELASYLKYLEKNISAYLRYFEWTKYYQKSTKIRRYCELCKYLHEHANDRKSKVIQDIKSWWFDGGQCIRDYALRFLN